MSLGRVESLWSAATATAALALILGLLASPVGPAARASTTAWCQTEAAQLFAEKKPEWAKDCLAHERRDKRSKTCVTICGNAATCRQTDRAARQIASDILDELDATLWSEGDFREAEPVLLRQFSVKSGRLSPAALPRVKTRLKAIQADAKMAKTVFDDFVRLLPSGLIDEIGTYRVVSDGRDGFLAETWLDTRAAPKIAISFDIADRSDIRFTYIHELAHVIALSEHERRIEAWHTACPVELIRTVGNARRSYLDLFVEQFWLPMGKKYLLLWHESETARASHLQAELAASFGDHFWSDYALTSPVEDFAESFAFFVLLPEPTAKQQTITDQKLRFFYTFPELRRLRDAVRWSLFNRR